MKCGAKLALILSFSHAANSFMFGQLRRHLNLEEVAELSFVFSIDGGSFRISMINHQYIESSIDAAAAVPKFSSRMLIPLNFSYNTSMHHQGALIIQDSKIIVYEPYGTYKKKINGVYYDYFLPIQKLLSEYGSVSKFHDAAGVQTILMNEGEANYVSFLRDFKLAASALKQQDVAAYSKLLHQLKKLDMASESSKLAYIPTIVHVVRDCKNINLFLDLYEKYSPYSCVSFSLIEMYEFFTKEKIWSSYTICDSWEAIYKLCNLLAPRFTEFVHNTPECKLLNVTVWNIFS
jgi:hypothetical protein